MRSRRQDLITGCTITVCGLDSPACPSGGTGILSSLGPEGRNRTTGRDATVILGTMRANNNSEATTSSSTTATPTASRSPSGTVTPNEEVIVNPDLLASGLRQRQHRAAGDLRRRQPTRRRRLLASTCQVEAPLPGDANGDFTLSPEDREFAVSEIFDGDGDTVGTVSGGTFAGSVGVDANDDGFVTAADLVAITKLLSP